MKNNREHLYDFLMTVLGVIIGGTVLVIVNNGLQFIPTLETWLSPVVRFGKVELTHRDSQKICFGLPVEKLAAAVPVKYEFSVEAKLSKKIAVSAYVADPDWSRHTKPGFENHPVGSKWIRYYCFETPATVADFQTITVSGYAFHRRHPIYDSVTPIPPFEIAGLPEP